MFKKSAVDLTDLAIGILILGIIVPIGADVLMGMYDARVTEAPVESITNESITSTEAGAQLGRLYFKAVTSCQDSTNGTAVNLATNNYSTSVNTFGEGTVTLDTTSEFNNTAIFCTYDAYNTTQSDVALPNDAAAGLGEYGNWFKILVIVGIAAVILALVFMAFGRGARTIGEGY